MNYLHHKYDAYYADHTDPQLLTGEEEKSVMIKLLKFKPLYIENKGDNNKFIANGQPTTKEEAYKQFGNDWRKIYSERAMVYLMDHYKIDDKYRYCLMNFIEEFQEYFKAQRDSEYESLGFVRTNNTEFPAVSDPGLVPLCSGLIKYEGHDKSDHSGHEEYRKAKRKKRKNKKKKRRGSRKRSRESSESELGEDEADDQRSEVSQQNKEEPPHWKDVYCRLKRVCTAMQRRQ